VLVGRDAECGRIDGLIEAARAGRSGVLVLRGEIGTGKSALLGYASERADELTLLATRPVESEAELPFAGLADLLRPLLSHLDALPAPQVAALAGALAIGPPVEGDRFAVCAATLGLLATAADERPLLVLVDSAQWLDRSSLQALVFAARRLESEAVAVLFAVRDGVSTALDGLGQRDGRHVRRSGGCGKRSASTRRRSARSRRPAWSRSTATTWGSAIRFSG
jgi:predicted ATPase